MNHVAIAVVAKIAEKNRKRRRLSRALSIASVR